MGHTCTITYKTFIYYRTHFLVCMPIAFNRCLTFSFRKLLNLSLYKTQAVWMQIKHYYFPISYGLAIDIVPLSQCKLRSNKDVLNQEYKNNGLILEHNHIVIELVF